MRIAFARCFSIQKKRRASLFSRLGPQRKFRALFSRNIEKPCKQHPHLKDSLKCPPLKCPPTNQQESPPEMHPAGEKQRELGPNSRWARGAAAPSAPRAPGAAPGRAASSPRPPVLTARASSGSTSVGSSQTPGTPKSPKMVGFRGFSSRTCHGEGEVSKAKGKKCKNNCQKAARFQKALI